MKIIAFIVPVCVSAAWLAAAPQNPQSAGSAPGNPAAIAAGGALFQQSCASCHNDPSRAPSLASGVFTHGGGDDQIAQTIRAGVPGTQMPAFPRLEADAVRQLVAYIRSLAAAPNTTRGDAVAGEALFRGALAVVAKTRDGREIRGVRRNEDTFSLQILDAGGQLHSLDKATLVSGDYAPRLSETDQQNLLAYLVTLPARGLTYERIRDAANEPHNWLTYWGDYHGTHYSALKNIDASNVRQLQSAWTLQMPGSSTIEATPLVVDGIMYTSGPPGTVVALDARTGRQIWRYQRTQKVRNPYEINPFNRGVAVLGNRVFVGTLDAALIALDARTGLPLWEVQMADPMQGFSITSPPLPVKDTIIAGIAGGEFGIRGFIDAYDAATGKRLWRFSTIPAPGEFGSETWKGDSWKLGCGATWLPGSYDADLDLLFWAIGNPCPLYNGAVREGDNLFTSSVVALDPATGVRKWHYQFSPHDTHDWDSNQDMILVDRVFRGQPRKLLLHADRNGHFYALDRTNGKFLAGTPFIAQTWNTGFDANGRPQPNAAAGASPDGSMPVSPTIGGATNFQAPSYSPQTGWVYLAFQESAQRYFSAPQPFEPGRQYPGGRGAATGQRGSAGIKAIDPDTGKTMWEFKLYQGSLTSGVLATAGGIVFAASREGHLIALDAKTGRFLWRFQTGAAIEASPMSYAVGGKQFVAVSSGNALYSFALPDSHP
jgi:alcohol dehydrogenase (cytochrome c)